MSQTGPMLTRPLGPERVRRLEWKSEDTSLHEIVEQLVRMTGQLARSEAGDDAHPHPRNCVMNMVALVQDREDAHRVAEIMADLAAHHPSRSIVLYRHSHGEGGSLSARVRCDAHAVAEGFPIQHEQVTLHMAGTALEHVRSVVEPLLIPDVRTHVWWTGTPPLDDAGIIDVLELCNTLVVDSATFEQPDASLLALAHLATEKGGEIGFADFHWARATVWRALVAQFFEPAPRRGFLQAIDSVAIDYVGEGSVNRIAAALLAGWLASTLGWKLKRASAGEEGAAALHMEARGGQPIEIAFRSVESPRRTPGEVAAVRIRAAADGETARLAISRESQDAAMIDFEGGEAQPIRQRVSMPAQEDAELLVELLVQGRLDSVYLRSLRAAAQLLEAAR